MSHAIRSQHDIANIENSILAYLARSPEARDTARGVCDSWLSEYEPRPSQEIVNRALDRLYRRGLLARELREGSAPLWSAPLSDKGPEP